MRRTSLGDIAVPFTVIGVTAYVLLRVSYGSIPPLQLYVPIPIAILGVAGAAVALLVRVIPDVGTVRAAAGDLRVGIFLLLAGLVLLLAGVLLERAGIDPNRGSPPTAGT